MSNRQRRLTPVAVPPEPRSVPLRVPVAISRPLIPPILVMCGSLQQELRSGSLLIGRVSECDFMLEDSLVSRTHARVVIDDEGVKLEDLHSTNGVYLNGERIAHSIVLSTGDQVLIGTQELQFAELRSEPTTPLLPIEEPPTKPTLERTALSAAAPIPITARADALELIGTLARRLANEQKADQAPRMLGPHLKGILKGASSGLVVPDALANVATEYAFDLAHWTADTRWLDYVVELHLATRRLMSQQTLFALQRAERWIGHVNRALLGYYVASFTSRSGSLSTDERARLSTLQRLQRKK
ncbi:MAG TPA: FHA domain-containing protein [Polyangiaceae bacterium]|nr:FHA domain-containing protein [Polyangiaceae bacterium]